MLTVIHPKLPMRNKAATKAFYLQQLVFREIADYGDYLLVAKDEIEIHFFEYKDLHPHLNYGQVYIRCTGIDAFYRALLHTIFPILCYQPPEICLHLCPNPPAV